ncbi:MAG: hypothetical protein MJ072_05155, partial [Clostridia bacterium]|nr:hypothetical protein [Clostridia bacterium]
DLKGWVFVEWSSANDKSFVCGVNYPSNMLYAKALLTAGRVFEDNELVRRAEKMLSVIEKQSYNGEFFEDNRIRNEKGELVTTGHISEACQYFAFFSGIATKESYPELYDKLRDEFGVFRNRSEHYPDIDKANIITGLMQRITLLIDNGENDLAVKELKEIYGVMARSTSTLWEHTKPKASCNHTIASYGAYLLVRAMTGLYFDGGKIKFSDKYVADLNCRFFVPDGDKTIEVTVYNKKRNIIVR